MDGPNEYRGNELYWAIETALATLEIDADAVSRSADSLVGDVWQFIVESCKEDGQQVPDRHAVVAGVRARLEELHSEREEH